MASSVDITTPEKQQLSEWKDTDAIRKLYNSEEYLSMPAKQKAVVEKHLYDTHIVPNFAVTSRKPPTFKEWMDFRVSDKFDQNISKMYDYFEPRTSTTERLKDYGTRMARSFTSLAENVFVSAFQMGNIPGGGQFAAKNMLDKLKASESKVIDKNSPVNASLTRRFFESLSDNSSDFAVWTALSEVTPMLGQVTKLKGMPGVVTGALGKLNLAQDLAKSKLGRFAMNRLIGAAEGLLYHEIQNPTKSPLSDVAVIAGFPRGGNVEIKKLLASQTTLMGPKATVAMLHAAMEDTGKEMKDLVVGKLTQANHEIWNSFAKQAGYSMYNVVPKAEKINIQLKVYQQLAEVMQSPLAHADPELQKFLVGQHLAKSMTPELEAGIKAGMEAQAKSGEKPSLNALVEEEVKKAKVDAGETRRVKALRIATGDDFGGLDSKDIIVPGAASSRSPEFSSNLPQANMRLEGDVNKYVYALGQYMMKAPNSPYAKHMLNELSAMLPDLNEKEIKMLPSALRQHMQDLITTGHTSPNDIRGVFRSTNLNAVFGKGMPTEFQDELADEVKQVQDIVKKKKKK